MSEYGPSPLRAGGTFAASRRSARTLLLLPLFLLAASPAAAIMVSDLVHDTPAMRKKYSMDIVGFSSETGVVQVDESSDAVDRFWLTRAKYIELGENEKADSQLESLISWRMDRGRRNLVSHAALVMREAFRTAGGGDRERAFQLAGYAVRLAPDYPAVYLASGYLALRRGVAGIPGFLQGVLESFSAVLRDAYHLVVLIGRFSGIAILVILFISFVWIFSLLMRYGVHMRHDVEEYLSGGRRLFSGRRRLFVIVGLGLPLVVFFSPLWLIVLGVFASWAYQDLRERVLSLLLALLLASLPLLALLASASLAFLGDDLNQALMAFRSGGETSGQAAILERVHRDRPDDPVVSFTLAQHYWRTGQAERAEGLYQSLRDSSDPLKVEATLNLGNILMGRGDLVGASSLYREAVAARPGLAAAHFNLGQAMNLQFQFNEGEQELRQAMSLDKSLSAVGTSSGLAETPQKTLIFVNLPLSSILVRLRRSLDPFRLRAAGPDLWKLSLTGVPAQTFPPMVAALAVLGLVVARFLGRRGLTRRCSKCGRPFCPLCLPGGGRSNVCPQCQHIFQIREGVESAMRVEKMLEINAYRGGRRRLGVILSALLPGGGQIYFGSPILGLLLAFFISLLGTGVLGWEGPFMDRYLLVFPWRASVAKVLWALLVLLYAVNLISAVQAAREER